MGGTKKILIVDDEHFFLEIVTLYFARQPFLEVSTADTCAGAIGFLKSHSVDLVVTDLRMPDMHGFELISYLREVFPDIPVIVTSADVDADAADRLRSLDVAMVLEKPFLLDELKGTIMTVLGQGE
jgi:DNA-binding NtrC family response regulator